MADGSSASNLGRSKIPKAKPWSDISLPKPFKEVGPFDPVRPIKATPVDNNELNKPSQKPCPWSSSGGSSSGATSERDSPFYSESRKPIGRGRALQQKVASLPNHLKEQCYKPVGRSDDCHDELPAVPGECKVNSSWKMLSNAPIGYQVANVLGDRYSDNVIRSRTEPNDTLEHQPERILSDTDSESSEIISWGRKTTYVGNCHSYDSLDVTPVSSEVTTTDHDTSCGSSDVSQQQHRNSFLDSFSTECSSGSLDTFPPPNEVSDSLGAVSKLGECTSSSSQSTYAVEDMTIRKGKTTKAGHKSKKSKSKGRVKYQQFEDFFKSSSSSMASKMSSVGESRGSKSAEWAPLDENEGFSSDILSPKDFPTLGLKGNGRK